MTVVYYAVEGDTDAPVAEKLIRLAGFDPRPTRVAGGKSMLVGLTELRRRLGDDRPSGRTDREE